MLAWLNSAFDRFPPVVLYAVSTVVEKSFSLITIPLVALYLTPAAYGAFDVAVVAADLVVLLVGMGMTEQLIRFASVEKSVLQQRIVAGEIIGVALLMAAVFIVTVMALSRSYADVIGLTLDIDAFRVVLIGSCLTGLIELPLAWIRLQDDAKHFAVLVFVRTVVQVLAIFLVLSMGYGAEGLLVANGIVLSLYSLYLLVWQLKQTPALWSWSRCRQLFHYGVPVLGAMISMYVLGNASRLFLAQEVDPSVVGHFGLASRLAMILTFALYPLELWWLPKRIAVLKEPGGLKRSAEVFGLGMSLLLFFGLGVNLLVPMFIALGLPAAYAGAVPLVSLLTLAMGLHAMAGLLEVGSYARERGYRVLLIDFLGASVAIIGFIVFIPQWGAPGAVGAMAAGQLVRIAGYLIDGEELAPIRYPWIAIGLCFLLAVGLVYFAPPPGQLLARLAWSVAAGMGLIAALWVTKLVRKLEV